MDGWKETNNTLMRLDSKKKKGYLMGRKENFFLFQTIQKRKKNDFIISSPRPITDFRFPVVRKRKKYFKKKQTKFSQNYCLFFNDVINDKITEWKDQNKNFLSFFFFLERYRKS